MLADDTLVLLDAWRGRWIGLNRSAAAMLTAIGDGSTVDELIADLVSRQGVSSSVVASDVRALLSWLLDESLVREIGEARPASRHRSRWSRRPRAPLPPRSFDRVVGVVLVLVSWLMLRCMSFASCIRLIENLQSQDERAPVDGRERFERIVAATEATGVLGTAAFQCLESSLAATVWCRLSGIPANWCLGARLPPFAAHAWTELDGVTPTGRSAEFVVIARI
ncbi:lasso peptide biosynthesis B2 protein [Desertimonas flava]|uniref:lasso peptide biosynthesis B2 protein n=1 Tax=Desertimonas flava TaxID=2064846 RepID=UPI0013C48BBF|nr:lasso peptide biosynthesis B2 protein [Desertimonas flava]